MNIEVWTKSKVHRNAIKVAAEASPNGALQYIVDHAGKPKYRAMPMLDIEAGEEFYLPRLGPFTIRRFQNLNCARKTVEKAVKEANVILEMIVKHLKITSNNQNNGN